MEAEINNYGKHYLVLVERITRLERDVVKVDAELDKANSSLRGAREDLREARQEVINLRTAFEASTSLLKQTELRIMAGLITAALIALIGLIVQNFGVP
jgi:septation ring formation regulator EzrA